MTLMFSLRNNNSNGNPFEKDLEDEVPSSCPSATGERTAPFIGIPLVIFCTTLVFVLLIAGTATTAISFPPTPLLVRNREDLTDIKTALDANFKLLGPLLITAGGILLVVDVILCVIITKDAYIVSRSLKPSNIESIHNPGPVSVPGGPFYLVTPNPTVSNPNAMVPFAFSRHLWTIPNAPTPDFSLEDDVMKSSKLGATTATLVRGSHPPDNPDVKPSDDIS